MKLRLFRSVVGLQRLQRVVTSNAQRGWQEYSGFEMTLAQLEESPSTLDECAEHSQRGICRLGRFVDQNDAGRQLARLSSHLAGRAPADVVELVVLQAPALGRPSLSSYLRDIQPLWSEFLEAHPRLCRQIVRLFELGSSGGSGSSGTSTTPESPAALACQCSAPGILTGLWL